jgi:hypothetical protein
VLVDARIVMAQAITILANCTFLQFSNLDANIIPRLVGSALLPLQAI